jgi:uncharacterized protein (TIGR03546 family)
VGSSVLEVDSLEPLFTTLYNMPIIPLTRFNNSIVMGSAIVTVVTAPLMFFLSRSIILKYRQTIVAKFKETKFWKAIKATSLYNWYYSYDKLY